MTFRRNRCRLTGKVMYWFTPIRYILRTICSDCGHEITKTRDAGFYPPAACPSLPAGTFRQQYP